ncbi:class I SAM-dependent methyltransferase [Gaiella sp.]|uniref:class I SAM-dependent methyltransferase n=1 Tax=Gaiella sp. TaxID=2663207 RepID=UPI003267F081
MTPERRPDFDARARDYDTLRPPDDAWWARFEALVELGALRGQRILDVGCGTGRLAAALATEARAKVWGVDGSEEMVSIARATVPAGVGIRQAMADSLPFRDSWFDRVTMSLVIHLVDRGAALAEARRVVAAAGRAAIATFHEDHFETYWLCPYFPSIRDIDRARFPTQSALEADLVTAGFPRVETRRIVAETTLTRAEALRRIAGRHISTFDLLPVEEIEEGEARAGRDLPAEIVIRLDQLVIVGRSA